MKTLPFDKKFVAFFIFLILILGLESCSPKITFPVSTVVPAAEPEASVKKTKDGEFIVTLEVNNLALPERLSPPKKHYLVWVDTENQGVKKLGEISNNTGIFRNRGRAGFEKSTLFKPTMIMVTAENNLEIDYPGGHVVLKSRPFELK
ncbi:MAG: hypothetical protein WD431_05305 [Cyclobacteriaceae bacterium]